jgi:hypothetical protein
MNKKQFKKQPQLHSQTDISHVEPKNNFNVKQEYTANVFSKKIN